ncbi:MAG: four helix bundle protein [Bacteroidales bacterium]
MLDYKDLDVWKSSRTLANSIYKITKEFPKNEAFGLTQQIRRSAVSVSSNIAEGIGRNFTKDTLQFLFIARGSLFELESQLIIAMDQNYLSKEMFSSISNEIDDCKKLLNGFINYHQNKLSKH